MLILVAGVMLERLKDKLFLSGLAIVLMILAALLIFMPIISIIRLLLITVLCAIIYFFGQWEAGKVVDSFEISPEDIEKNIVEKITAGLGVNDAPSSRLSQMEIDTIKGIIKKGSEGLVKAKLGDYLLKLYLFGAGTTVLLLFILTMTPTHPGIQDLFKYLLRGECPCQSTTPAN